MYLISLYESLHPGYVRKSLYFVSLVDILFLVGRCSWFVVPHSASVVSLLLFCACLFDDGCHSSSLSSLPSYFNGLHLAVFLHSVFSPFWTVTIEPFFSTTTNGSGLYLGDRPSILSCSIRTLSPILMLLALVRRLLSAYVLHFCLNSASLH